MIHTARRAFSDGMSNPNHYRHPGHERIVREVYEDRQQLVNENEAEIADLKRQLERATLNQETLLARRNAAKKNYEAAKPNKVDHLEDDGGSDEVRSNCIGGSDEVSSNHNRDDASTRRHSKRYLRRLMRKTLTTSTTYATSASDEQGRNTCASNAQRRMSLVNAEGVLVVNNSISSPRKRSERLRERYQSESLRIARFSDRRQV
ncbi:unnamed protein product [Pseudo-nitzschia multistriata]|uniref:Uncharacterized protein n=1 Tax=Pseudo-nitzschia multistriata TaxID=183589 RepID=A0A448ZC28_9STRA|nr:unnamed protein product [Pseudo-nitzschia multistriata]